MSDAGPNAGMRYRSRRPFNRPRKPAPKNGLQLIKFGVHQLLKFCFAAVNRAVSVFRLGIGNTKAVNFGLVNNRFAHNVIGKFASEFRLAGEC